MSVGLPWSLPADGSAGLYTMLTAAYDGSALRM